MTPPVNVNLDVYNKEKVNLVVDSGAQVSLVGSNILKPEAVINPNKKVKMSSIHGTEETLGEIGANIVYKNMQIPINLQVMKNSPVPEDGIIGFDVLKPYAVINGHLETLTWTKEDQDLDIPIQIRYRTTPTLSTLNSVVDSKLKRLDIKLENDLNEMENEKENGTGDRLNLFSNLNLSLNIDNVKESNNFKPNFYEKFKL